MTRRRENNDWAETWEETGLEERFDNIVKYYGKALYKAANRAFCDKDDGLFEGALMNYDWAQDAVQDALEQAYRYLKAHPAYQVRSPKTWIFKITTRRATSIIDRFYMKEDRKQYSILKKTGIPEAEELERYRERYAPLLREEDQYTIERLIADREQARELHQMIDNLLSEDEKTALRAKYFEDLSYKEIAARTGKPIPTLRSLVSRAIEKLRTGYAACNSEDSITGKHISSLRTSKEQKRKTGYNETKEAKESLFQS